jgi:ribosome-binding factor A
MSTARMRRVNEVIREVVGAAIAGELQDPRIGFVTVTAVDTSPDLRTAEVHVSVLGSDEEKEATMAGLRAAHGVIQRSLAGQIHMKHTPKLTFAYDDSIERADRLNRLMDEGS